MDDPPALLGLNDQARALRLALGAFTDDRRMYDAALTDAADHMNELVWALTREWVAELVGRHGSEGAKVRLERELAGIAEHWEEQLALGTYNPKGHESDGN